METLCSLVFGSSLFFLPRKATFLHSLRLSGQLQLRHGSMKLSFPSIAVIGTVPVTTSDFPEVSTSGLAKNEARFHGQEKQVEDNDEELKMLRVCDKLIEIFLVDKPNPADWRKLLAFSRDWCDLGPHFYKRCQERADAESDPGMKHKILRLSRKLKEVDDDVKRHNDLLEVVKRDPSEIMAVVKRRRKDFTEEFFMHVRDVAQSYYENPEERDVLINLGKESLAAAQSYDNALGSMKDMKAAEAKFSDMIFAPAGDIASNKIDDLAKRNQLNSFPSMLLTKAWSDAKETTLTKDEALDMMYDNYMGGLASIQEMIPKDIRLLKCILAMEDPQERLAALNDAFTPSLEYQTDEFDYVWTTPEALHKSAKTIIDAFILCRRDSVTREARDMLQPRVIQRLEELKKMIEDNFL